MLLHLVGLLDRALNSQVTGAKPLQVQSPADAFVGSPLLGMVTSNTVTDGSWLCAITGEGTSAKEATVKINRCIRRHPSEPLSLFVRTQPRPTLLVTQTQYQLI